MTRFAKLFDSNTEPVLIPYFVLGYPDPEKCLLAIKAALAAGAKALELGIAFSDPLADGPVIQQATQQVIAKGFTTEDAFTLIEQIRALFADVPIGLLLYGHTLEVVGIDNFFKRAKQAGVDAVLMADVPLAESEPYDQAALRNDIDRVFLATPSATTQTLKSIAEKGSGFTYVVSRRGVTGVRQSVTLNHLPAQIQTLKELGAPPPVVGFGISTPEDKQTVQQAGAKGYIIGSKCVSLLGEMQDEDFYRGCPLLTNYLKQFSQG